MVIFVWLAMITAGILWLGTSWHWSPDYLVVHCSDTPARMDIGAKDIDRWHRNQGWQGIGYHWVIRRNGKLEMGRPENRQGAHTLKYNHRSLGICLVGGRANHSPRPINNFTRAQFTTLKKLLAQLKTRHPRAKIVGHGQLNHDRACPSFDVTTWVKQHHLADVDTASGWRNNP
jgi:N-acetylmuramoyl-L-alanine amidase